MKMKQAKGIMKAAMALAIATLLSGNAAILLSLILGGDGNLAASGLMAVMASGTFLLVGEVLMRDYRGKED